MKAALFLLAGAMALALGLALFLWTRSYFLLGCWCAGLATLVNEASFGSRPWIERAVLIAFVIGVVTIFGPMAA